MGRFHIVVTFLIFGRDFLLKFQDQSPNSSLSAAGNFDETKASSERLETLVGQNITGRLCGKFTPKTTSIGNFITSG
jgi:hypothetical protein